MHGAFVARPIRLAIYAWGHVHAGAEGDQMRRLAC